MSARALAITITTAIAIAQAPLPCAAQQDDAYRAWVDRQEEEREREQRAADDDLSAGTIAIPATLGSGLGLLGGFLVGAALGAGSGGEDPGLASGLLGAAIGSALGTIGGISIGSGGRVPSHHSIPASTVAILAGYAGAFALASVVDADSDGTVVVIGWAVGQGVAASILVDLLE